MAFSSLRRHYYLPLSSITSYKERIGQAVSRNFLHVHLLNVLPLAARTPDIAFFAKLKGKVKEVVTFTPSLTT